VLSLNKIVVIFLFESIVGVCVHTDAVVRLYFVHMHTHSAILIQLNPNGAIVYRQLALRKIYVYVPQMKHCTLQNETDMAQGSIRSVYLWSLVQLANYYLLSSCNK